MTPSDWLPKSVLALRDYNLHKFSADLVAGVTVGLVALPLAMAFAIAAGAPPKPASTPRSSPDSPSPPSEARAARSVAPPARSSSSSSASSPVRPRRPRVCTLMAGMILVLLGRHRPRHRRQVHPAPGHRRLHQRHRHPHRQHPDQRLLRPPHRPRPRRLPRPNRVLAESANTISPVDPACPRRARPHRLHHALRPPHPGIYRCPHRRHAARPRPPSPRRDHRLALRRHPPASPASAFPTSIQAYGPEDALSSMDITASPRGGSLHIAARDAGARLEPPTDTALAG